MSELTIITNNVPRDIVEAYELPPEARKDFDYLDWTNIEMAYENPTQFFKYKGEWYDLNDGFETTSNIKELNQWDGYQPDSFFSGILVKYVDDFERVIVGRYYT